MQMKGWVNLLQVIYILNKLKPFILKVLSFSIYTKTYTKTL